MKPIDISIDASLVEKKRFETVTYTNKDGVVVSRPEFKIKVIPLREEKVLASGDTWELVKTCFVTHKPTKEEVEAKTQLPIIGSGTQFRDKVAVPSFNRDSQGNEIKGYDKSTSVADDATIPDIW